MPSQQVVSVLPRNPPAYLPHCDTENEICKEHGTNLWIWITVPSSSFASFLLLHSQQSKIRLVLGLLVQSIPLLSSHRVRSIWKKCKNYVLVFEINSMDKFHRNSTASKQERATLTLSEVIPAWVKIFSMKECRAVSPPFHLPRASQPQSTATIEDINDVEIMPFVRFKLPYSMLVTVV